MTSKKEHKKQSSEEKVFTFIYEAPFCVLPKTIAKQCKLPIKKVKGAINRLVAKKRIESTSTGSNFRKNRKTYYGVPYAERSKNNEETTQN
jgi:DNA-binding MarR family transcriptional regulator